MIPARINDLGRPSEKDYTTRTTTYSVARSLPMHSPIDYANYRTYVL